MWAARVLRADAHGVLRRALHTSLAQQKEIAFVLADIGEGITEAQLIKWHVKEGQHVNEFDLLCEVQSDKANTEITSRYTGRITKLCTPLNEIAFVGKPLIMIDSDDAADHGHGHGHGHSDASHGSAAGSSSSSSSSPASSASSAAGDEQVEVFLGSDGNVLATPAVRRIARENAIDLARVRGSGKDGRVMKEDVLRVIQSKSAQAQPAQQQQSQQQQQQPQRAADAATAAKAPNVPPRPAAGSAPNTREEVVPIRGFGRAMVKSMEASLSIPHLGFADEIRLDELAEARSALKSAAEAHGVKFTFMPLFLKAVSLAITQYPIVNSSLSDDGKSVIMKHYHNIGVAMDTPGGLVVPNIKNVESLSLLEIASELARLQAAAAEMRLKENDLKGGTITLSNIGTIGGTYVSPVLVKPEVVIGGIGRVMRVPRYASDKSDHIVPQRILTVSWSADHRVVDGASIARFAGAWKQLLENPTAMMLHLR